ncbi:MAG: hypothetical protein ABI333_07285 [bacterium]
MRNNGMHGRMYCTAIVALFAAWAMACGGGGTSGTECGNDVCEDGEDSVSCPSDCTICDNNGYCNLAAGENAINCPGDCPVCLEDGVCNRAGGENGVNCPMDCPLCVVDGYCDTPGGEDHANCPDDCDICLLDGLCDAAAGETLQNCPLDCGACVVDGVCDVAAGETAATCPDDCDLCVVDGVCDAAAGEDASNCPADCAAGGPYDYIVSELYIPTTSAEAQNIGVDVDGDGTIDNKLGQIMSLLMSQGTGDPNTSINADIDSGDLVIPLRLFVDAFPTDASVLAAAYQGVPLTSPPLFNGTDVVDVAPGSPTNQPIGGDLMSGTLDCGPGQLLIPVPLVTQTVFVSLQSARVLGGPVTATGWTDVMVGGGITEQDMESEIIPALATYFNDVIASDPFGSVATTLMDLFDGNCEPTVPGCASQVPGVGECAVNNPTDTPPVITVTELLCNALLNSATAPDVDSNGDGVNDLLSVGFRVQAVSATINLP